MRFEIWDARRAADRSRWTAVHRAWGAREVFAHPAYVHLFAGERDEPLAAYAETASGFILYPFVLRPVDAPHLVTPGRPVTDIVSPYGYGGAFHHGAGEVDGKEFWALLDDFCRARGVVSEFTRLSLFEGQRLPYPGRTEQKLVNVVRDLRVSPDELWRDVEPKVRKNVNRARRLGVRIERDETGARLDDFLRTYRGTMDRRGAGATYYFPTAFFRRVVEELPGQFAFFHALHGDRVVSSELVLVSAENLYSYLGGTDATAFALRPNDLLKFEVIRWGRELGKTHFVLGGGQAADDGIFRYKRAFAPRGLVPYHVGTRVLDAPAYHRLVAAHRREGERRRAGWRPELGFFPAYRQVLPPEGDGDDAA